MTDQKISLTGHLTELRKRLLFSVGALMTGFIVSFNFSEDLFRALIFPMKFKLVFIMQSPFVNFIPSKINNTDLIFTAPGEAFWMHLKVSFMAGLFLAMPFILYQLWKFISPGLKAKEKKYAAPFVVSATLLFFIGAAFCFLFILPFAMGFLLTYKTESLTPMLSAGNYVSFCVKFILAFGAVFELPIIIIFLTRMGFVTTRTLAKNRKYAILAAFIIAAMLTPTPDAFNQLLMAVPIMLLYEVGILFSKLLVRKKKETAQTEKVR